jgi:NADH:flavin oxidoreductases, Old Yellow Enzyme family
VAGWKRVTAAVHQAGGKIFLQLWHVGRISHPDFHGGALPVAPSAISPGIEVFTEKGPQPTVTPRALELAELPGIVEQYRKGAQNAKLAGFDGVELHGANGYLLDQFTRDGSNKRTDAYGGSIANRARLPLEVTRAVIEVWGAGARRLPDIADRRIQFHVGFRPGRHLLLFDRSVEQTRHRLSSRGRSRRGADAGVADPAQEVQQHLHRERRVQSGGGERCIARGEADLVAFGALFLANPDLPRRFEAAAPLNTPDQKTFYAGEDKGYVDYPALG